MQQIHDGLVERGGIAVQGHCTVRQGKCCLNMILLFLFGEIVFEHLLILSKHRQEVSINKSACPVFQHFFHSLEGTGGVLAILINTM